MGSAELSPFYQSIHKRLNERYPKTGRCETCGRDGAPTDYAFRHHPLPHTRDRADYMELCRSCHTTYDADLRKKTRDEEAARVPMSFPPLAPTPGVPHFAGYVRVSTGGQGDSGLGLEAQESAIRGLCALRGLDLGELRSEVVSGAAKVLPVRDELLFRCRSGQIEGIIVAKLDRVARSAIAILGLVEDTQKHGYRIVIGDPSVEIPGATPADRMFVSMVAVFAQFEREMISQRTKDALGAAKARGQRLGRPQVLHDDTIALVRFLDGQGLNLSAIGRELASRGISTAGGGPWRHSTIRHILNRAEVSAR